MGFVTLGFFIVFGLHRHTGSLSGAAMAVEGGMVQMVSHGFISGALFLCVGAVSYTHLDVYKRQLFRLLIPRQKPKGCCCKAFR